MKPNDTRPDAAVQRKIAGMFLLLWGIVLGLTIYRYLTVGDMVVTLGVSAAAVALSLARFIGATRRLRREGDSDRAERS